jgi:hypothetical protein
MYNNLAEKIYSLHEFTTHAKYLTDNHVNPLEYIRFVLTGEVPGEHQAHVNALLNKLRPQDSISTRRDYPCVLGFTRDLVAVNCPVIIYPICDPEDAITTTIHLDYYVRVQSFWF